jgi:uncharacterized membrane protein YcgQ (UPF0703/DUF1980 family)
MHRLRTFIGLLALSTTLISIFYITSKGTQNSRNTEDSLLVQNLRQSNTANSQKIEELEKKLAEQQVQQEILTKKLSETTTYLNNLTSNSLLDDSLKCMQTKLSGSNYDFITTDIDRYKKAFINKNIEVRSFMQEKLESNKGRFIELGGVLSPNVILLYSTEVTINNLYPNCEATKSIIGTYEYDYKKNTFKKV